MNHFTTKGIIVCLLFVSFTSVHAQQTMNWDDFVQSLYDEEIDVNDELLEELQEIHNNPINLNSTNDEELKKLPFLSTEQVNSIMYYIEHNSPVRSLGELMLIPNLTYEDRMRLILFCYVGEENKEENKLTLGKLLKFSKNEFIARTDFPFYVRQGYKSVSDSVLAKSPNKVYRGNNNYHSIRYSFSSLDHLYAGLEIEKDAGEKEFDYVSAYAMIRNIGRVHSLIIGDFKASFGQGLVVNNGMSFGKLSSVYSLSYLNRGIFKHSSMSESNHFRGLASDLRLSKDIHFTTFISYQNIDGTLLNDSANAISSLKQDGLHRTKLEISKKGIIHELSLGSNIQYYHNNLGLGISGIFTHFSMPLEPKYSTKSSLYRKYNLQGDEFLAMGLYYGYRFKKLSFQGETAFSKVSGNKAENNIGSFSGLASVNSLRYSLSNQTILTCLFRYYEAEYATLYGNSFGENSNPQNESGLFLGIKSELFRHVNLEGYIDGFYFPWRKYQVSDSSNGLDGLVQLSYVPNDKSTFQLRYRIKSKQKDCKISTDETALYYYTNQNLRLQHNWTLSDNLSLKTTANLTLVFSPDESNEKGWMISENIRWTSKTTGTIFYNSHSGQENKRNQFMKKPIKADLMVAYFNTDNYNSRVYTYEPSLLYSFGMTSFFYHGVRLALTTTIPVLRNLYLTGKISSTMYFNRDSIGTSLDMIDQSHKEDLQLQVRYVF